MKQTYINLLRKLQLDFSNILDHEFSHICQNKLKPFSKFDSGYVIL